MIQNLIVFENGQSATKKYVSYNKNGKRNLKKLRKDYQEAATSHTFS